MSNALCMSMRTRAVHAAILSFPISGVIGALFGFLGDEVPAFDITGVLEQLQASPAPTVAANPGRLQYDADGIAAFVGGSAMLGHLTSYLPKRAALQEAVALRQNIFLGKYNNADALITLLNDTYNFQTDPTGTSQTKIDRLSYLLALATQQAATLSAAYQAAGITGAVSGSTSTLSSTTQATINANETGATQDTTIISENTVKGFAVTGEDNESGKSTAGSSSQGLYNESQTVTNADFTYRTPSVDAQAKLARAQISLTDQLVAQYFATANLGSLSQIWANELAAIDYRITQLQARYMETFLTSPLSGGRVTGRFKRVGEFVQAGEPVLRIEDPNEIYLVTTLRYDGMIDTTSKITVTTLRPSTGDPVSLACTVVSARGGANERQLEVVLQCSNLDASGALYFPLNYNIPAATATITIA